MEIGVTKLQSFWWQCDFSIPKGILASGGARRNHQNLPPEISTSIGHHNDIFKVLEWLKTLEFAACENSSNLVEMSHCK